MADDPLALDVDDLRDWALKGYRIGDTIRVRNMGHDSYKPSPVKCAYCRVIADPAPHCVTCGAPRSN